MKKVLVLILSFYILTLFQTSFFIHFNVFSKITNVILILTLIILINLLEKPENHLGLWSAGIYGFFLDIFSTPLKGLFSPEALVGFFGFHILILLIISVFIKIILRKYVRFSFDKRTQK